MLVKNASFSSPKLPKTYCLHVETTTLTRAPKRSTDVIAPLDHIATPRNRSPVALTEPTADSGGFRQTVMLSVVANTNKKEKVKIKAVVPSLTK